MGILLSQQTKLFLDKFDLTLGGREVTWETMKPIVEVTDLSDSEVRQYPSIPTCNITYAGLWRTDATANEPALRTLIESTAVKVMTMFLGTTENAEAVFTRLTVSAIRTAPRLNEAVPLSGDVVTDRTTEFGRILLPKTSIASSSGLGQSLDGAKDGAGSSGSVNGVVWGYHIFALSSSATRHISLQHASSADGPFVDFDADSSVAVAAGVRNLVTGTLKRYTRFRVLQGSTGSGSSCAIAAFIRRL
jgi:hypothetical protein